MRDSYIPDSICGNQACDPFHVLSRRFVEAVDFAIRAHGDQTRKGGDVPYVSHLLAVAALIFEAGGDEDMAIAGLLHDALEDTATTSTDIESRFGRRVASIVEGCTDTEENPKPRWRPRKERYLTHLRAPETTLDVLIVSRADKLHNAQSMLREVRELGAGFWTRFNAGAAEQLWYLGELIDVFTERLPGPMTDELRRTRDALAAEVA
jgi:(p)ppGpp synthase/HD superfamily hydrolase